MGSYPGARLQYGIDLGDDLDYDVDDTDAMLAAEFPALTLNYTGDLCRSYTRYILAVPHTTISAYEAMTVTTDTLTVPEGADAALKEAFRRIAPEDEVPEPRWMITVHYG